MMLSTEYGLGAYHGDLALLEVVAHTAVQVVERSAVKGTPASIGVWMSKALDVQLGSVVQCFASYDAHRHGKDWCVAAT